MSATRRRRLPRLRAGLHGRRLPRPGGRLIVAVLVVAALLAGAFLWVRQSSLVAVRTVTITGVSGPDAGAVRSALTNAAIGMSTLDLDPRRVHAAVAPYPVVRAVRLRARFPHGLQVAVSEQVPVAVAQAGGQRTVVSADGTLLPNVSAPGVLPTIALSVVPGGTRLTGAAAQAVSVLAAAPYRLLAHIASAGTTSGLGLDVVLRDGPTIYFGSSSALAAKWRSAIAVLAAPTSAGASYIDVTDPGRPAAGAGADAATPASGSATATTGTATP